MNLFLWILVQSTSKMCPFHISKNIFWWQVRCIIIMNLMIPVCHHDLSFQVSMSLFLFKRFCKMLIPNFLFSVLSNSVAWFERELHVRATPRQMSGLRTRRRVWSLRPRNGSHRVVKRGRHPQYSTNHSLPARLCRFAVPGQDFMLPLLHMRTVDTERDQLKKGE